MSANPVYSRKGNMTNSRVIALLASLFLIPAIGAAADKAVDLSGKWTLDNAEESFIPQTPPHDVATGGSIPGTGGGRRGGGGDTYPGAEGSWPTPRKSPTPQDLTLTIVQNVSEITFERQWTQNGQPQSAKESFTLDGRESLNRNGAGNVDVKSKTRWRKNGLVIDSVQHISAGKRPMQVRVRQELSLSKDGRQLTVTTSTESTRGQLVNRQVFKKS